MFPRRSRPTDIDTLIGAFLGTNALVDFSRAQTLSGAEAVITLSRAHGIKADFERAVGGVPLDSSGEEVELEPFTAVASVLAQRLLAMLEARERAIEEAERKAAEEAHQEASQNEPAP